MKSENTATLYYVWLDGRLMLCRRRHGRGQRGGKSVQSWRTTSTIVTTSGEFFFFSVYVFFIIIFWSLESNLAGGRT